MTTSSWDDIFNGNTPNTSQSNPQDIKLAQIMYSWHVNKQYLLPEDVIGYMLDMGLITPNDLDNIKNEPLLHLKLPTNRDI